MNAVAENEYVSWLRGFGAGLRRPHAIVAISAHWQSRDLRVTAREHAGQVYDFLGFPRELYEVQYSPPGHPALAERVAGLSGAALDQVRELDHGVWSVLLHLFPGAGIPVVQLSMPLRVPPQRHFEIGASLRPLLSEDVLILGSGNIVHNLSMIDFGYEGPTPHDYAQNFDRWFVEALESGQPERLLNYEGAPDWRRAVPTTEHYLPALYILGLMGSDRKARPIYRGFQNRSISMTCFEVAGEPEPSQD